MDEGARQANQEIRENASERELLKRLDRIIVLLEMLTKDVTTIQPRKDKLADASRPTFWGPNLQEK